MGQTRKRQRESPTEESASDDNEVPLILRSRAGREKERMMEEVYASSKPFLGGNELSPRIPGPGVEDQPAFLETINDPGRVPGWRVSTVDQFGAPSFEWESQGSLLQRAPVDASIFPPGEVE